MPTTIEPSTCLPERATAASRLFATTSRRIPTHRDDYGDNPTVGLHLKRRNLEKYPLFDPTIDPASRPDFGIYLGQQSDGFVVALKDLFMTKCIGIEVFETEEALHEEWTLD